MGFFQRILNTFRKTKHDPLDVVSEFWEANFKKAKKRRFIETEEGNFRSFFKGNSFVLELKKTSLFAWVNDALYRYRDVIIDGTITFDDENGYSSAGFIFRYLSEDTYYYFLVSNKGYFRFDVVFNGNPLRLIGWTEMEEPVEKTFSLRIIAHGSSFVFCVNDTTVAEIEDETIDAGGIAFAAQNYEDTSKAVFYLNEFLLESRPYNIEAQYVRWKELFPIPPRQRIAFAESLYNAGHYNAAVIQYRKAARYIELNKESSILLAECLLRLELYEQVLDVINSVLLKNPSDPESIILKADALYSLQRLIEARDFIAEHIENVSDSAVLWNLYGNVEYTLGNLETAVEKYEKARGLDSETPLFSINAGKSYRRLADFPRALTCYTESAVKLFRQEAYDELAYILKEIEELEPEHPTVRNIRGKIHFHEGNFEEASRLFNSLIEEGEADASVYYLAGLLELRENNRRQAMERFERAAAMEDDFYLYWFRLAETRHALGEDPGEALQRALECGTDDPWVDNFAGLVALEREDYGSAEVYLRKAYKNGVNEADICINLSHALVSAGKEEEALELLENFSGDACPVWNRLGNVLAYAGKYDQAARQYEKCIAEEPDNIDYLENAASLYIELDQIPKAEELLRKALTLGQRSSLYNLMGNVAVMLGEYSRAEKTYETGLEVDKDDTTLRCNFADMLYTLGNYQKARQVLDRDETVLGTPRGRELHKKIKDSLEITYTCAVCGREWTAPKEVPEQGQLRLRGEPPDESPAGECPDCGKVYCVACAKAYLDGGRFSCKECGTHLKLIDNGIKYLVSRYI